MSLVPKKTDAILQQKVSEVSTSANNPQFPKGTVAPTANQVPEGGWFFATIAGTSYAYTKLNGVLKRVALS